REPTERDAAVLQSYVAQLVERADVDEDLRRIGLPLQLDEHVGASRDDARPRAVRAQRFEGVVEARGTNDPPEHCVRIRGRPREHPAAGPPSVRFGPACAVGSSPYAIRRAVRPIQPYIAASSTANAMQPSQVATPWNASPTSASGACLLVATMLPERMTPNRLSPTIRPEASSTPSRCATAPFGAFATRRL